MRWKFNINAKRKDIDEIYYAKQNHQVYKKYLVFLKI